MSKPTIDASSFSGAGMPKAEEFYVNQAYLNKPIGARGNRVSNTSVGNIPDCVCAVCGGRNKMYLAWVLHNDVPNHIEQGYRPVPEYAFRNDFNGGRPMTPFSPTKRIKDGAMVKESGMAEQVLMWTVCSNRDRLTRLREEVLQRQLDGQPTTRNAAPGMDAQNAADSNALVERGIIPEQDVHINENMFRRPEKRPLMVSVPGLPSPG